MDVSKFIDRAEKEAGRKSYDLAISLFDQVLVIDPNNGPARSGKRRAELSKYSKSYPSSLSCQLKNLPHSLILGMAKLCRLHNMAANQAEKALSNDPRNVKLNLSLGQALMKAGHKDGAEAAFAVVTEFDKNDIESLKILGKLYYDSKKYDKSLDCYERVLKVSPRDQEAVKMRKNLAAEGAIKSGGFEQATSARDLARSEEQMEQLEKRQKLVQSADQIGDAIKEVQAELKDDQENADLWLRLGNLQHQSRELKKAAEAYAETLRLRPDDYETATRLGDVKLQDYDQRIRALKEEVKAGEEGADDMMRRIIKERKGFRIDEFRRRMNAHPTDTGLRFKLGQYLLDDNQLDEALAEFQLVVKDPRRKYQAMMLMGRAFLRKGMGDLAIKQLKSALEGMGGINEKNLEIVYNLAQAHEEQGDLQAALSQYTQIYEVDISYKNVGEKIEDLRSGLKSEG